MKQALEDVQEKRIGYAYGIAAFTAWGVLPVFWKLLRAVSPGEILASRIIWSFVFVSVLLAWTGGYKQVRESFRQKKSFLLIIVASLVISINWFTYIWAVNSGFVLQASLGYYINPLVVFVLSITVVKEKFTRLQMVSLVLASSGVMIMTYQYGRIPFVALTLAVSFALYGLIKRYLQVDSVLGLALETIMLTPFALGYLLYKGILGTGTIVGIPPSTWVWLVLSGVVTATPLVWFARSAKRIEFASLGFLQYIAPTLTLLLGVFLFKEEFSRLHLVSFGFIWAALLLYTYTKIELHASKGKVPVPHTK